MHPAQRNKVDISVRTDLYAILYAAKIHLALVRN